MKRLIKISLLMGLCSIGTSHLMAQVNLTGRVYHNPNIIADKVNLEMKDFDKKMAKAKAEGIKKAEEKKGRKLTDKERAEVENKVEEAKKKAQTVLNGFSTGITLEFLSPTEVRMRSKVKIDDEAMKAAGMPWLKRKALKATIAVMPETEKGTYTLKDNLIIIADEKEPDTLYLSADGKQISGKLDKDNIILRRTK